MNSPWEMVTAEIRKLADRLDGQPTFREATVAQLAPLEVLFDTDTEPTTVARTLAPTLKLGDRVLTMRIRHYLWVIGRKESLNTPPTPPPANPHFFGLRSGAIAIPHNAWTPVVMSSANEALTFTGLSVSTHTITIQRAGLYTFYGAVKWTGNGGGNSRAIAFMISDYPGIQQAENNLRVSPMLPATIPTTTSWTGPLSEGCTVQLVVVQNSGATLNAERVELGISYIGPRA